MVHGVVYWAEKKTEYSQSILLHIRVHLCLWHEFNVKLFPSLIRHFQPLRDTRVLPHILVAHIINNA